MKNRWGFGLSLAATTQRLSTASRGLAAEELRPLYPRPKTQVWISYFGLFSTAAMAAAYPLTVVQHRIVPNVLVFVAIVVGAFPFVDRAVRDLMQKRAGTAFCVSLALATSLAIDDRPLALNLLVFALLTQAIEDWAIGRSSYLPSFRGLKNERFDTVANTKLGLAMFEKNTASWLQDFFKYLSLAAATFTLFVTGQVRPALAVLIIGSASGLGVGMYLLDLGCAAQAVRRGLLVKRERFMERLATVNVAVLDQAGISGLSSLNDLSESTAEAFCCRTRKAIQSLRDMSIETVLFTSALQPAAEAMGRRLGASKVEAELFPEDKPFKIAGLQQRHRKVVFFGDETCAGSSLAIADVGIEIVSEPHSHGSEADAVFLNEDLNQFADAIRIARRAQRIATVCFAFAVVATSVGIGVAMQGKVSPQWAIAVRFTLEFTLILGASQLLMPPFGEVTRRLRR